MSLSFINVCEFAQLQGSKKQSEDGTLIILSAGDRSLYDECQSCFDAMGQFNFYLGDVGTAAKMYLVLQLISGVQLAALGEAMALGKFALFFIDSCSVYSNVSVICGCVASKSGLSQKDVLDVLAHTQMSSPMLLEKGKGECFVCVFMFVGLVRFRPRFKKLLPI